MATANPKTEDVAAPEAEVGPLPEVRQCTDPEDPNYGSVAVASGLGQFKWLVAHPANGGHWESDDNNVGDWPVSAAGRAPAKKAPAAAPTPPKE